MTTIGNFSRDGDGFSGTISTLALRADVRIVPNDKRNDKAPDYRILVSGLECGAGWRAADEASGALINVKLDDPTWPAPLNARLMRGEGGAFPLTWIRRSD